jgi:hypothetical protein
VSQLTQHSRKLKLFGEWMEEQAAAARAAGASYIRRAKG